MMSNDQQTTTTPSPLANHPNGYKKNAVVTEVRKKLDDLLNKDCLNNNNNNNNNDDDERRKEDETRQNPAIGQNDPGGRRVGSGSTASWSPSELADGAKASAKYYSENATKGKRKPEQDRGVYAIFCQMYMTRTGQATRRTANGLSQKLNGDTFNQLKDANMYVIVDSCGKETSKTFEAFAGALTPRSGKTMEVDGEHALVQAYAKATHTAIPPDRSAAIAQINADPLFGFWKENGIANPNVHERFTKISGNIPEPTKPSLTSDGSGRRDLKRREEGGGRGKGKKAARRIDVSNEEARNFRQMAAANEARLQDRAMKVKESELAMTLLNGLPDGEGKAKLQEKLIANVAAMLGVPNEAPAAPAAPSANETVDLISDEEDEDDK